MALRCSCGVLVWSASFEFVAIFSVLSRDDDESFKSAAAYLFLLLDSGELGTNLKEGNSSSNQRRKRDGKRVASFFACYPSC